MYKKSILHYYLLFILQCKNDKINVEMMKKIMFMNENFGGLNLENILNKDIVSIIKPYYNYNNTENRINKTKENLKRYFEYELRKHDVARLEKNEKYKLYIKKHNLENATENEQIEYVLKNMEYMCFKNKNYITVYLNRYELVDYMVEDLFVRYKNFLNIDPYEFLKTHLFNIYYCDIGEFLCFNNHCPETDISRNKYLYEKHYFCKAFPKYPYNNNPEPDIRYYLDINILIIYLIGDYNSNINHNSYIFNHKNDIYSVNDNNNMSELNKMDDKNITKQELIYILYLKYPELFKMNFKIDLKYIQYYFSKDMFDNYVKECEDIIKNFGNPYGSCCYNDDKYNTYFSINPLSDYNINDYFDDYKDPIILPKRKIPDKYGPGIKKDYLYNLRVGNIHFPRIITYLLNKFYHNFNEKINVIPNIVNNNNLFHIKDKILYFHNIHVSQGKYYFKD